MSAPRAKTGPQAGHLPEQTFRPGSRHRQPGNNDNIEHNAANMNEVIISSKAETYCQDTARRQLDAAIAQASRATGALPLPLTGDNLIAVTRVAEMQLLGQGVQPSNLAGTVVTYVPEVPKEVGASGCAVLQLVLRRTVDEWCLSSITPVHRRGGTPMRSDISLSKAAQADQQRRVA